MIDFLETLQDSLKMGLAGSINYLQSIEEVMDFRKAKGVKQLHVLLRSVPIMEKINVFKFRLHLFTRKQEWSVPNTSQKHIENPKATIATIKVGDSSW